ncbi:uncharacterized protein K02A2.6-like [Diaphorina citri]|uniref:RNA-directed DNA polymerase n=2 Tax=Diaphorina citri TaxID=121845 RepID=A0A1S3DNR0_DIACI|nr:uncharacterized protein K02A2.6-like [Diaphorina citri]
MTSPLDRKTSLPAGSNASMMNVAGVSPLNFSAVNLAEEWKLWLKKYQMFEIASNFDKETDQRRVAMLMHSMGGCGMEIFNSFNMNDSEQYVYNTVVTKFTEHFDAKCPITLVRHKFFTCKQQEGQSIMEYVTELQNLSLSCKFQNLRAELVRDIFIAGLSNKKLQMMLLKEQKLDIDKAVNMCRAVETSMDHVNKTQDSAPVMKVTQKFIPKSKKYQSNNGPSSSSGFNSNSSSGFSKTNKVVKCYRCGRLGHYRNRCRVKMVSNISSNVLEDDFDQLFIGEVVNEVSQNCDWSKNLSINNHVVKFKLDTGSPVNLLSLSLLKKIFPNKTMPHIIKSKWNLCTVTNEHIPVIGSIFLLCKIDEDSDQKCRLEFVIVNTDCNPLLGLKTCTDLNLIARIASIGNKYSDLIVKYSDVFSSQVGNIGPEYHIKLSDNAIPRIDGQRKIPFALKDQLKLELDRMEKAGIITRIIEPTEWVNSIVVVKKPNNKLRICLDPRYLNQFIVTSNSSIPTFEQIASNLANAKYFSVLDCNSGFWQIPLDSESAKLCTFNSPLGGRYMFKKLPFGLSCSSEAFQERINFIFENEPGVALYIDDLIVWGESREEHDKRLNRVLEIARKQGLRLNKEKCKLGVEEVKFLGHIFSNRSMAIDPSKISAVLEMPNPTCKKDLERIIGFFNYLSRFIPNFSDITAPLRELMKKSSEFVWTIEHTNALNKLKQIVTSSPVLKIFDPSKEIVLSVDSSVEGVGAVLLQEGQPVAFASKSLSPTQKKSWAQIEREMYAIVFGCVRFHQYIFGAKVLVETDHKALENLFCKPMNSVPARIQRMMLKIQNYNLQVKYKAGRLLFLADTLSRASLPNHSKELLVNLEQDIVCQVNSVVDCLPVSKGKLDEIKRESQNDEVHKLLRHVIFKGWPNDKNKLYNELKVFWTYREDLHVIDDIIFKNNSLLIPKSLQKEMLCKIHEGHMGMNLCCNRAKHVIFWPNMYNQIKEMCSRCDACLSFSPNNTKESLITHEVPELPWIKLGCDLFEFNKIHYLILVDYYSKFFEIVKLDNLTAQHIITHMKSIFARHGIPKLIVADSGTQFTSQLFKQFSLSYEFDFVCSSPYHHKSNGLAEAHVKIVKNILKKCEHDGTDPYLAILNFRNTPKTNLPSPANLLFSRSLRTKLPCHEEILKPKIVKHYSNINRSNNERYYNKSSHNLKPVDIGDSVYFKKDMSKPWVRGKILSKCNQPRSYVVEDENNSTFKRNRVHIKVVPKNNDCRSLGNTPFGTPIRVSSDSSPETPRVVVQNPSTKSGRSIRRPLFFSEQYQYYN